MRGKHFHSTDYENFDRVRVGIQRGDIPDVNQVYHTFDRGGSFSLDKDPLADDMANPLMMISKWGFNAKGGFAIFEWTRSENKIPIS